MGSLRDSLVGKVVLGLAVSPDAEMICFKVLPGPGDVTGYTIVWDTEGDCCSNSWWNDGYQLSALWGAEVTNVREVALPDAEDNTDELVQCYGVEIVTLKGVATLVYRNASNGYYGGNAFVISDQPEFEWNAITTSDWSA